MAAHLEHLFGGFLDGYQDGLVELAWTDTRPDDKGKHPLRHAKLFGTDRLDDLVEEAVRLNATPMCNVYIGAALRRPETAPFGRGSAADAWALTAFYVDLDEEEATRLAKDRYAGAKPTLIVRTGKEPHTRAQMWWRLEEPIEDQVAWSAALKGMGQHFHGDEVFDPPRVMRLAGSVAWPVKDGRVLELTGIIPLKEPGAPVYSIDHLTGLFPPAKDGNAGAASPRDDVRSTNSLGLGDKINDGRERYMRDTALAVLIEFIGENGCAPSAQELFDAAWPQYERNVDFSRGGRGPNEFAEKCTYTLRRFEAGEIRGAATLDEALAAYQRKKAAREAGPKPKDNGFKAEPPPQPEPPKNGIRTADFMTLMTEVVEEEPDYIEPDFAGPGNFVLIAGPPKAQKSFLLQEMLVAAATGDSFLGGTFRVPRPLRVFYLQAEMNRKLLRKRAREMQFLSAAQKQLLSTNLIVSERFHMILNDGGVAVAIETINRAFPDGPPDIIAVDPLANVFDQENENDNAQMMRFLTGRLEAVRQKINPLACLVLVHHAAKKSTEDMARDPFVAVRGAGALRGYYDSAIVIYRESEEGRSRKIHFELRGGESPEPMSVELVGGRFQKANEGSAIDKPMARKILQAMREAWDRNAPWSPYARSQVEGRYAIRNASEMFHVPPKAVEWLLEQWIKNGVVTFRPLLQKRRPAGLEVTGSID